MTGMKYCGKIMTVARYWGIAFSILTLIMGTVIFTGCISDNDYILVSFQNNRSSEIEVGYNIDYGVYEGNFYLTDGTSTFLYRGDIQLDRGELHTIAVWWGYGNQIKQEVQWFYNITQDVLFTIHENGSITYWEDT